MKTLVRGLSVAVHKAPWVVIALTIIVSMALGGLSAGFVPEEDSNDSFAPEAPELAAAERIGEIFGEESSVSIMQIIVSAPDGGDLFSLDGLAASSAINQAIRGSDVGPYLIPDEQQPAVVSFLAPVEQSIFQGAPAPTTDDEVKQAYLQALAQFPEEQSGQITQLLSGASDATAPTADKGLILLFNTAGAQLEVEEFVDLSSATAAQIAETPLPGGFVAEPFSFELLFADQDEFQSEIGRLFGTAGLIILAVLAMVFMIIPREPRKRFLVTAGLAAIVGGIVLSLLPTLATILPDLFPDAWADWPSGTFFLVVVGIIFLTFTLWSVSSGRLRRTVADTLVTLITIFFAIAWMNGLGFLIFTEASPMAQILPILLIGLGVDYSIHVTTRYRDEIAAGAAVDSAVSTSVTTVGIALVLATLTTAVGFLTNVTNEIPALREFGMLAAIGIVVSFLLMLTFVPAVRLLLDRRAERNGTLDREALIGGDARTLPRLIGKTSGLATKAGSVAIVTALILGGFGAWGVTNLDVKFSFLDFIPTTSPLRGTFETLIDDFGGGFGESTQILVEGDVATAAAWNGMVAASGNLTDTPNVVTFAGSPAGTSPVAAIAQMAIPDSPTFVAPVAEALQAIGVQPDFTVPAGADIASVYDVAFDVAPDAVRGALHRDGSNYDAALFDITTQAGESGASDLRIAVADDFQPVEVAELSAVATSNEIINDVVVTSLRDSQVSSLILTLIAALILLVVNFWYEARRPMLGVITTIPVALVVLWSFGLMVLFGIPFGPVTATIAALAIGIGIPYMIHITHRYLEERTLTDSPEAAIKETLTHTGGALAGSAITTIAGFGILVTSTTIPFRQFGFVTAYTILLALIGAILLLPSMLVVWDRWHRNRGDVPVDIGAVQAALDDGTRTTGSDASQRVGAGGD